MRVHFIAIGGSVMHQLALALRKKGDEVTGSDDEIFEPAASNLKAAGIFPKEFGWFPEKITLSTDAVILGMHARQDNPELLRAQELKIPVYSFPEFIYQKSIDKKRVAVGGSHGKTTITSMIMHVLKSVGKDFDYLVGARLEGFEGSVKISDAPLVICEADEYPASVVEKRPKFHFFLPNIAVISGIAWDHINVFPTFEIYCDQFKIFIEKIEPGGLLVYNRKDDVLSSIVEKNMRKDIRYVGYTVPEHEIVNGTTYLIKKGNRVPLKVFGEHNLSNSEAAYYVCRELGISTVDFLKAISEFKGAAKRLENIFHRDDLNVFRDFAHAPSKVKASTEAVRAQYPDRRLVAVFELHTYSSLNENFMKEYHGALEDADVAIVFYSRHALAIKRMPFLDPEKVRAGFGKENLIIVNDKQELQNALQNLKTENTNFLFMSSGDYDGLNILQSLHLS